MLSLPPSVRVFVCTRVSDMRWSFDRLALVTREVVREDPFSGHLFVFRNRRGDRVKVLYWDRIGYCIWYKRLEAGTFELPEGEGDALEMEASEFALVLEGIDLSSARRRKRFVLKSEAG